MLNGMGVQKIQQTQFCGTKEAAQMIGVSPDTIRRWAKQGSISHIRTPGGRLGLLRSDVEALLVPVAASSTPARADELEAGQ